MAMTQLVVPGPNKIAWAEPCEQQNPSSCIHPGPLQPSQTAPEPKTVQIRAKRISPPEFQLFHSLLLDQANSHTSQAPHANYPETSSRTRNTDRCRRPGLAHLFLPSIPSKFFESTIVVFKKENTLYHQSRSHQTKPGLPARHTWEAPSSPLSAGPAVAVALIAIAPPFQSSEPTTTRSHLRSTSTRPKAALPPCSRDSS